MKTTYFANCKTIEEAKRLYHKLTMENHPDRGGKLEVMQAINAEYDIIAVKLANIHESASGEQYTAEQKTSEIPADFRDMINKLIHLDGVTIELVGRWIWLSGNTYCHKDIIKQLGFKWASNKKAWYWHRADEKSYNRKKLSLDDIKTMYGCTAFQTNSRMCIA